MSDTSDDVIKLHRHLEQHKPVSGNLHILVQLVLVSEIKSETTPVCINKK